MKSAFRFTLDEFNPDAFSNDELGEWIIFIGVGRRPSSAKHLFRGKKGMYRYTRAMRNYCWNKLAANHLRLAGKTVLARKYERICNQIYKELPPTK
jgi:hypothetical protein